MHRTGSEHTQSAGLADGGGQPPAAAPHHTTLYDGVTDAEKFAYSVHVALLLGLLFPKGKQKTAGRGFGPTELAFFIGWCCVY